MHVVGTRLEGKRRPAQRSLEPAGTGTKGEVGAIPAQAAVVVQIEEVNALVPDRLQNQRMLGERPVHRGRTAALATDDEELGQDAEPA